MSKGSALRERFLALTDAQRRAFLKTLNRAELTHLSYDWSVFARANQLPPPESDDTWRLWFYMGGRGSGKTHAGAEAVRDRVKRGLARHITLAAPTAHLARTVMVEGVSGILSVHPPEERPLYEPSKRRLTWPNGAVAHIYSSDEPELARGPQGDTLWADDVAAWRYAKDFWDNLNFGLRLGRHPRAFATTTPKPIPLIDRWLKNTTGSVRLSRGSLYDNMANLADSFIQEVLENYEGTRLGRQEIYGEYLDDVPGALWTQALIEAGRSKAELQLFPLPPRSEWVRCIVGVDPAVTNKEDSDETGITAGCAAYVGDTLHAWVLEDLSGRHHATEWARLACAAYHALEADRIVGEANNGGDLVEINVRTADSNVSYRDVHATRGKRVRAAPVAALYEQGRVHHVGVFGKLEDQMCSFVPELSRTAGYSPDRVDSLVWTLTALLLQTTEVAVR